MKDFYKFIIQSTSENKINKETAVEIIKRLKSKEVKVKSDIAIIGMSANLPLSQDIDEFWNNINNHVDLIEKFPKERQKDIDAYLKSKGIEDYKYAEGSYLSSIDKFDYNFFKMSPREADLLDPNQRLFLETAFNAVESAGYGGSKLKGTNTGVYVGFGSNVRDSYGRILYEGCETEANSIIGNLTSVLPSRISYLLDLKGPSMVIDTACSSSLVAIAVACQSIKTGLCDMAIAGGVKISLLPLDVEEERIGMESSDARTRTFDESSDGAGAGEGVGAIILKSLDKAIEDGDNILAVIKGSFINQDGNSIGLTAPNPASQAELMVKAWKEAGVSPETISYIEAHGTGTNLGDPIEIKALNNAFRKYTNKTQFCAISSVKSNLGHLYEASGIINMIMAISALKNKKIPPTNFFNMPNKSIDFVKSPIYVNTKTRDWEVESHPRRCGVSSFGISGTNCHIVLEEAPQVNVENTIEDNYSLFTISAKTENSFINIINSYKKLFNKNKELNLKDVCYTANTGRGQYQYRTAFIVETIEELKQKLEKINTIEDLKDYKYFSIKKVVPNNREKVQENEIKQNYKDEVTKKALDFTGSLDWSNGINKSDLEKVCDLYVLGADINWEEIYKGRSYRKVSLPVYHFEKIRCWYQDFNIDNALDDNANMFYTIGWQEEEAANKEICKEDGDILAFANNQDLSKEFIKNLRVNNTSVIEVNLADHTEKISEDYYLVGNTLDDYKELFSSLKERNITKVVHMLTLGENIEPQSLEQLEETQSKGVYSLYYIVKALLDNNDGEDVEIIVVSSYVNEVTAKESYINPHNATLFGFGRVIGQEYPNFRCKCIDTDDSASVDDIFIEMNNIKHKENQISYRNGKRYVEVFVDTDVETKEASEVEIKENGVYVITGGTGGIGIEIAKSLAVNKKVNLAILGRTELPEKESWNELIEENKDKKLCKKLQGLKEIEEVAGELSYYAVDVSKLDDVTNAINDLRNKYGKINGVIHSAGLPGSGFILGKTEETLRSIISPKVYGTWILDYATKDDDLDFFVMFSSGITLIGEAGQSDYVAANSYLDAYTYYRNRKNKNTTTINWASWKETGMSLEFGVNVDLTFKAIPTVKAIECFEKVLNKKVKRTLIGELNINSEYITADTSLPFALSPEIDKLIKENENNLDKSAKKIRQNSNINISGEVKLNGKTEHEYTKVEKKVAEIYSKVLGFKEINIYDSFFELGGDSMLISRMYTLMEKEFPGKLKITDLFEHTSISKLAKYISENDDSNEDELISDYSDLNEYKDDDIAIIGVAAEMPRAKDIEEFWENIEQGVNCFGDFPKARQKDITDYLKNSNLLQGDEIKYQRGAFLDNIDEFDYKFFKLSPNEARLTDPYQRLLMKTIWHSIEDAGYAGRINGSNTGVYVGFASSMKDSYQRIIFDVNKENINSSAVGNITAMMPTRISYLLDLRGPTMVVDTACSSTLVAVHLACQALKNGDCDMALAGGVRIVLLPLEANYMKIGIEASDGETRTFDKDADGSGLGEGSATVLLKPLKKAIADKDNIYAVIKGSAINQDGSSIGITAPNPDAQTKVILKAWKDAKIDPLTISHIEAHGTATRLGDPIEIESLSAAYRRYTDKKGFCPITTIKSNIGHLFEGAGIAGLVKTILMLKHREIPPTVNFINPNDKIIFNDSPIYVNTKLRKYEEKENPMRCAINAFGFSGTNCHMIVEEAPKLEEDKVDTNFNILTISAKSEKSFWKLVDKYKVFIDNMDSSKLQSLCYTSTTGRGHYDYRVVIVAKDYNDLKYKINLIDKNTIDKYNNDKYYYGMNKSVSLDNVNKESYELTDSERVSLSDEAKEKVIALAEEYNESLLSEICRLYIAGANVDWLKLYNTNISKMSIPQYPYETHRCWVNVPQLSNDFSEDIKSTENLYYDLRWEKEKLNYVSEEKKGAILVLKDKLGRCNEIVEALKANNLDVISLELGEKFKKVNEDNYIITEKEEDYCKLIEDLKDRNLYKVIHGFTLSNTQEVKDLDTLRYSQEIGVYSLFYLTRAILASSIESVDIALVSSYINQVSEDEKIILPENAPMFGLGKVITQEYPHITCRAIDIDDNVSLDEIIKEIMSKRSIYKSAYRNGERYVEQFTEINLDNVENDDVQIREDGVYIITGGADGIGAEFGKYLASKGKTKVAIFGRTSLPEPSLWEKTLNEGHNDKICKKISAIKQMQNLGAEVSYYSVDVTKYDELNKCIEEVRSKYGKINGIIHSAGVAGAGYIIRKDEKIFNSVLSPKIIGTWNINKITNEDNLDFLVLFSSAVSINGEAGQGDYVAANSYLDSFTEYRSICGQKTLTVNWVQWKEAGMSVAYKINIDGIFRAISTEEAINAFDKAISKKVSRVVIGELNYQNEFLSVSGSLPFNLSPSLKDITERYKKQINSGVISNGKFEIARVKDGKVTILPRGKDTISNENASEVVLKGKDTGSYSEVEQKVAQIYSKILGFNEISIYDSFFELGGDSIMLTKMQDLLEVEFPGTIKAADLFAYTSIYKLSQYIVNKGKKKEIVTKTNFTNSENDIAIIGISLNVPKGNSIDDYWENIKNNVDFIGNIPESRKKDLEDYFAYVSGKSKEDLGFKYVEGAFIDDIDKFDYKFFKMSPKESSLMDPYQRLFLQNAWGAIEDAGYGGDKIRGTRTGVYVGYASNAKDSYQKMIHDVEPSSLPMSMSGNITAIMPSRLSYLLDLKGPTMVINTACSAALVSLHLACQAIRLGECDMAIAGGVRLNLMPFDDEFMKVGVEAATGRTKSFDDSADGAGMGEGLISVLVKPLSKAMEDRDSIYAVIKGSAMNQDGASIGITAPNPEAQEDVIVRAWENAKINPETLGFIEAHGTATKLGDPLEIDGLTRAFERYTDKKQICSVGSVKSNIGHLYECSGLAGLVKGVQALRNKEIPKTLHFKMPNRKLDFCDSPLYVNTHSRKWEEKEYPRRCGISAFGISGTNCHMVLEEAPIVNKENVVSDSLKIFTISAMSKNVLEDIVRNYISFIEKEDDINIDDLCYTANTGRGHYNYRIALIVKTKEELLDKLKNLTLDGNNIKSDNIYYAYHKIKNEASANSDYISVTEKTKRELSRETLKLIDEFISQDEDSIEKLNKLCDYYINGADIEWDSLYKNKKLYRLNIPVYPFEKIRCWIDLPENVDEEILDSQLVYTLGWTLDELEAKENISDNNSETILLFKDILNISLKLIEKLNNDGNRVIEVEFGEKYKKITDDSYVISGNEKDYIQLIEDVKARKLTKIIHMSDIFEEEADSIESLKERQDRGAYCMFYLARAIAKNDIKNEIDILLVGKTVNQVTGKEANLNPSVSPLFGICKVINKEFKNINCSYVDIDDCSDINNIILEFKQNNRQYGVAYRDGKRYVEEFKEVEMDKVPDKKLEIKENGVYVITGGTGGIGLSVAKYLSSKNNITLHLINRSMMPNTSKWNKIIEDNKDKNLVDKINKILEIEKSGSKVVCHSADVSNIKEMKDLFDSIRSNYGKINGVIHGAGVDNSEMILGRNIDNFNEVFNPKIYGAWVLDKVTENDELDFFVMFSSIATILSAPAQDSYVAGNSYLDSFTDYRNKKGKRTLTVNWSTWKEVGMAARSGFNVDTIFKAMTTEKALCGLEQLLNKDISKGLIGIMNFESKVVQLINNYEFKISKKIGAKINGSNCTKKEKKTEYKEGNKGVKLLGKEDGVYLDNEIAIAEICKSKLGFNEIDVNDNFFELGADSIILAQIHAEIVKRFSEDIKVTDLFEYPTISKLAEYIDSINDKSTEEFEQIVEKSVDIDKDLNDVLAEMESGNKSFDYVLESIKNM